MNKLILTLFFTLFLLITKGQDNNTPIGYRLKKGDHVIKVFQDHKGVPDFSIYNLWIYNYWFQIDGETMAANNQEYIKVTIPSKMKWSKKDSIYKKVHYGSPKKWKQEGAPVDEDDYNSWLWIKKADFEKYNYPYYGKLSKQFVFSGLTAPYRYRPKTGTTQNILTGDVNLGTFIGIRVYSPNKVGISIGGTGGLGSFLQNSSNNFAFMQNTSTTSPININTSQSIAGFSYGGVVVIDWQKKFQMGIVFGYDHGVGELSKTYIYQDKYWLALSLNYQFLDFGKSKLNQTSDLKGNK